jgi:hypothetical protein
LKNPINDPSDDFQRLNSFYYPEKMGANEAHMYGSNSIPSESMEISASNYYTSNDENFSNYPAVTTVPSADEFEFEKINPSDIMKININTTTGEIEALEKLGGNKPNITQPPAAADSEPGNSSNFSKLLFSSPSATVTSHGPSGPFKAIICHDCDNSEGRNVGHSVSFSAIKSWNVGSSNTQSQLEQVDSNRTSETDGDATGAKTPVKYFDNQSHHDENQQIEMNDKVELFKVENIASETEAPIVPTNTWNYSLLPINNEKHFSNNNNSPTSQKKPIFNDLLKVPYDILNAPLTETPTPSEPVKGTQILINHQQKFNDTITSNYQHFQQFIQKNLKPNMMQQHYQSTPMPEQNYEVDESVSLMTNGRAHGVQSTTARGINSHADEKNVNLPSSSIPQENEQDAKFGYVVEGRNFRKYRVEEKTADGFIVG